MKIINKLIIIIIISVSFSETDKFTKIGYIDSEAIMTQYEDVRQVQVELEKEQKRLETLYKKAVVSYDSLAQAIQASSIIMSEPKIKEMENKLLEKQREIEGFQLKYFGPQGELYKMQAELMQPIIKIIDQAVQNVGKERGYDYIFDAVQGSIVYALEANNLTLDVMEELKKLNVNKEEN